MANNPYFPYSKVSDFVTMPDAENLLKKVVDYLLDLPMKGYAPPDDTSTPRSRLIRLLYYDTPYPLEQPLPTPEQKISIVFDPESPDVPRDTEKGYRIFPMIYPIQAESAGRTSLKIFLSYAHPRSTMQIDQAICFEVLTNTAYENNSRGSSLSRSYQICLEILRSLNGVNMDGVGGFHFDRRQNTECQLEPIADRNQNVGYRLTMGLTYMGSEDDTDCGC